MMIKLTPNRNLQIHAFFEFFASFEKRKSLGFDHHFFTGLGVPAGVAIVGLDEKAAQAPDLNTLSARQALRYMVEKKLYDTGGLRFGDIRFNLQCGDQLHLGHTPSLGKIASKLILFK
jgi:hypothetical protein